MSYMQCKYTDPIHILSRPLRIMRNRTEDSGGQPELTLALSPLGEGETEGKGGGGGRRIEGGAGKEGVG